MNEFNPQSKSTIGVEFAFKTIEIRGDEIKGMFFSRDDGPTIILV